MFRDQDTRVLPPSAVRLPLTARRSRSQLPILTIHTVNIWP